MPLYLEDYLLNGPPLYEYMIKNFDDMLDNNTIKHFNIIHGTNGIESDAEEINMIYGVNIQEELVKWIKIEHENGNLFNNDNWRPFRSEVIPSHMYIGYRKMFQYKQYYFQLALNYECIDCTYCKNDNNMKHFELVLYGWKDNTSKFIQPDGILMLLADNIIPESFWILD
jgi:hypothetical protein